MARKNGYGGFLASTTIQLEWQYNGEILINVFNPAAWRKRLGTMNIHIPFWNREPASCEKTFPTSCPYLFFVLLTRPRHQGWLEHPSIIFQRKIRRFGFRCPIAMLDYQRVLMELYPPIPFWMSFFMSTGMWLKVQYVSDVAIINDRWPSFSWVKPIAIAQE